MDIQRSGSQASDKGANECFTPTAMTHIGIQEDLDGTVVEWTEEVSARIETDAHA